MTNTIWTNEELKQIKEILQSKMIFKKEKDGTIRLIDNRNNNQPFKGEYNVYSKILYNETVKLLESNDKEEIEKLVKKHSKTEFDSNNRLHYGLISQDVEDSLNQLDIPTKDFAGFIKSPKIKTNYNTMEETIIEGEYTYGLRYEEFIAPLIKLVQVQENRIRELEEKIEKLIN